MLPPPFFGGKVICDKETWYTHTSRDSITCEPLPGSSKVYLQGSRPDLRVPMRDISLSGVSGDAGERGDLEAGGQRSLPLYDTSGPYTDSTANVDIRLGLRPIREAWIREREDAELLEDYSSPFTKSRRESQALRADRFPVERRPLRAKAGRNVTQMHYARRGIVTPEMEFAAIRENQALGQMADECGGDPEILRQHPGQPVWRKHPESDHT